LANQIASFLGYTPRQWRKLLVSLSKTVEQQMCANDWENINFSQVPSVASARYKRAFHKHATEAFGSYVEGLKNGTETVHAGAVYPYQVIQSMKNSGSATEIRFAEAQWNALPNYVGNVNILPMVDVSGSMGCPAGGSQAITCMDVAISLGLYLADKNTGTFKDLFLTFSATPEILHLSGDLYTKYSAMSESGWGMNTNLVGAMEAILNVATLNNVAQSEMPTHLLILSDMQFDQASNPNQTAMDMIEEKFLEAGYNVPAVVFWNLNAHDNVPVRFDEKGTALISGFSPAIMKSVLKMDVDSLSPISIMLDTILSPRYD
jgi:hypothetical protein